MGKRSRQKRLSRAATPEPIRPPESGLATPARPRLSGWRLTLLRLALIVPVPVALLGLTEATLRWSGYGYSTRFFEKLEDEPTLTTNPQFAWQYYSRETATAPIPLVFPFAKSAGTLRIIVLGESAAAGTPDPAFGFARILEVMLRRQYPSNRFEVLNAAMRGIDSHIILPIARECAALSPDLFVVYMGNNELIGLHAPSPEEINFTRFLRLLRLGHAIKATRLSQLLQAALRRFLPKRETRMQDMEYLRRQRLAFDDRRRNAVYENFQANLADIGDVIRRSGAPAILATLAVNLGDFPPLASLHRRDLTPAQLAQWDQAYAEGVAAESNNKIVEALDRFEAAARVDDHYAELHFRLARGHEAAGKLDRARQQYALARDWDALQFRADTRLNAIIQRAATNGAPRGIRLVDLEQAFTESPLAEHGVPGKRLFQEHVHFTFAGDYHAAKSLLPAVAKALRLSDGTLTPPSPEDCARALAFTPVDELNVRAAMVRQTAKPPFLDQLEHAQRQAEAEREVQERLGRITTEDFERAAAVYREAIARDPGDWMLHYNFGNLLSQSGQHAGAVAEYEFVVKRLPRQRAFRMAFGNALLQAGRGPEALAQFRAALQIDPDYRPAQDAILAAQRRRR